MTKISYSGNNEKYFVNFITDYLKKDNISQQKDDHDNIIVKIDGKGAPLVLVVNVDTQVEQKIVIKRKGNIVKTDGKSTLGLDRVNIITVLEILKYLKSSMIKNRPIEAVFVNDSFEHRSLSDLDYAKIKAREAICLYPGKPVGTMVKTTPFVYSVDIEIVCPQDNGVNALFIAAQALSNLKLGKINKDLFINMNGIVIEGPKDAIPHRVKLTGEIRAISSVQALSQLDQINKAFKKFVRRQKAKLVFKSRLASKGKIINTKDDFWKLIATSAKKADLELNIISSCDRSNIGVLSNHKINAVQIGCGGKHTGTNKEMIRTSEISDLAKLIILVARNV